MLNSSVCRIISSRFPPYYGVLVLVWCVVCYPDVRSDFVLWGGGRAPAFLSIVYFVWYAKLHHASCIMHHASCINRLPERSIKSPTKAWLGWSCSRSQWQCWCTAPPLLNSMVENRKCLSVSVNATMFSVFQAFDRTTAVLLWPVGGIGPYRQGS